MRIISVDPGFDRVGVAILSKEKGKEILLFSSCILTNKKSDLKDRILEITEAIENLVKKWEPETLAIEKLFFTKNQKTAMGVSEARGAIIDRTTKLGLSISEFTPLEIKTAVCGYGKASKSQVADMVRRLIKIEQTPKFDDEYDAIACGLTYFATRHTE